MDDALEVRGEERFAEGKAEGMAQGIAQGMAHEISIIRKKIIKHMPVCEISELFELPETQVSQIVTLIETYPEENDIQIAGRYLNL